MNGLRVVGVVMGGMLATTLSAAVLLGVGGADAAPRTGHDSASPLPQQSTCGVPDRWYLQADPTQVAAGEQVTLTGILSINGCHNQPPRHITLLAAAAGTSDYSAVMTQEFHDDSGRFSFLVSPETSTSYNFTAEDGYGQYGPFEPLPGDHDVTVLSSSPSPTCTATGRIALDPPTITATGTSRVTVQADPHLPVDLFAYTQPDQTYVRVRSGITDATGAAYFEVRPPANTRLVASRRTEGCTAPMGGLAERSVVLNVRTALSLFATRNGPADYTFSGDSLPAREGGLIISLYRVTSSGDQVLTAQTRASAVTGEWRVRRGFTGRGRFVFVARTGQDVRNAPGTSNARSTLIY